MYISTIYVCRTVLRKPDIFMVDVTKIKHVSQKSFFLAPSFVLFTHPKRQVDFSWKFIVPTQHVKIYT
jgi:hypothetical protein